LPDGGQGLVGEIQPGPRLLDVGQILLDLLSSRTESQDGRSSDRIVGGARDASGRGDLLVDPFHPGEIPGKVLEQGVDQHAVRHAHRLSSFHSLGLSARRGPSH
jgi:hypothetical protein